MFGLSFGEVLIIMVVALLVLGPERLPKVAKNVGKGMREFRRATGGFRQVLEEELYLDDDEAPKPAATPRPNTQPSDGPAPVPRQAPVLAAAPQQAPAVDGAGEDGADAGAEQADATAHDARSDADGERVEAGADTPARDAEAGSKA